MPCLGGEPAAFSEGPGENVRMTHPGISGNADLSLVTHGWTDDTTARLSLHGPARDLQVNVRNLTAGQPITPPIVVIHRNDINPLPLTGRPQGLEELAEAGQQKPLMDSLRGMDGVRSVTGFGDLIHPGEHDTVPDISAGVGDHVTVITMLACTNDAVAIGTAMVPVEGSSPAMSGGRVYDAGTANNDESSDTVPCLRGEGVSEADGEGEMTHHAGISGVGDLDESRNWSGSAMRFVVDANGADVPETSMAVLTIENLTPGKPITPPVAVAHDRNVNVFSYTMPSELDGIDDLSEGGATGDLIATLRAGVGVVSVQALDTGGPIIPGASYSTQIEVVDGAAVTVAGMFACTNDAYIVSTNLVDISDGLVAESDVLAHVFDSGAENNDETMDTVPCLGGGPAAFSDGFGENVRTLHSGISGGADLSPETHGWTAATTTLVSVGPLPDEIPSAAPVPIEEVPSLPVTGDYAPSPVWTLIAGIVGLLIALAGSALTLRYLGRRVI